MKRAPWLLAKSENPEDRKCLVRRYVYAVGGNPNCFYINRAFYAGYATQNTITTWPEGREEILNWKSASSWGLYPDGAEVHKGKVLFPRIDPEA